MTEEKRSDRRIQRTRLLLRDALIALILEKGYEAVTVQAITERADLNRATFYLHYRDKADLFIQSGTALLADLVSRLTPVHTENSDLTESPEPLAITFRHVLENEAFYRVLLTNNWGASMLPVFRSALAEVLLARLRQLVSLSPGAVPVLELDLVAAHLAGSLLAIITWWLDNGLKHDINYMAERAAWLTIAGTYTVLGIPSPDFNG